MLIPILLYQFPTEGIFNGESICIFNKFLGTECWGCGITRAFFSVLQTNFAQAWSYNPLILIVFPLLLWIWYKETIHAIRQLRAALACNNKDSSSD
ncbi:MAG: DUF2752 domain-containing protein [Bacteroidaceae bacterium]|nr:DUF2752 domain-containing protein [Bacteroidaceae bacterium]